MREGENETADEMLRGNTVRHEMYAGVEKQG
jgi:hypothetical protein